MHQHEQFQSPTSMHAGSSRPALSEDPVEELVEQILPLLELDQLSEERFQAIRESLRCVIADGLDRAQAARILGQQVPNTKPVSLERRLNALRRKRLHLTKQLKRVDEVRDSAEALLQTLRSRHADVLDEAAALVAPLLEGKKVQLCDGPAGATPKTGTVVTAKGAVCEVDVDGELVRMAAYHLIPMASDAVRQVFIRAFLGD